MASNLARHWRDAFWQTSQAYETAQRLREAANTERLGLWTQELTSVVIETCQAVGLQAAAKRNILDLLPIRRQEYLAIDVMTFPRSRTRPCCVTWAARFSSPLALEDRAKIEGQTLLVIGSRSDAARFPYGFFKWWELSHNSSSFSLIR